jgi:hypothetical protein
VLASCSPRFKSHISLATCIHSYMLFEENAQTYTFLLPPSSFLLPPSSFLLLCSHATFTRQHLASDDHGVSKRLSHRSRTCELSHACMHGFARILHSLLFSSSFSHQVSGGKRSMTIVRGRFFLRSGELLSLSRVSHRGRRIGMPMVQLFLS